MRCSKAREFISDALDERLPEAPALELAEHLGDCVDCRTHQRVLEQGQAILRSDLEEPAENFEWKVQLKIQQALRDQAAVDERSMGWRFWKPALTSAAGVALVVIVAGGLLIGRGGMPGESGPASPATFAVAEPVAVATEAGTADAVPDLSGAVRRPPIRVVPGSGGFGIRTVSNQTFVNQSPFTDPVRSRSTLMHGDDDQIIEVRAWRDADGEIRYQMYRHILRHGGNLNLELHRSTLRGPSLRTDGEGQDPDS